jgi:hypothetical protein
MKSDLIIFILIIGLLLVSGCKDPKTGIVIPETIEKYPTALNMEWEYETTNYVAKYDKNGNLGKDSLAWPISYSVVRITSTNDSVYGEKNLCRFDYGSNQEYSTGTHWYRNNDQTLEMVAYSGNERDRVTPKERKSNILTLFKYRSMQMMPAGELIPTNDSIYLFRKKVLEYPLIVGKSWDIFLPIGWRITRTILGKQLLPYRNGNVDCYDIKSIYYRGNGLDRQLMNTILLVLNMD